MSTAPFQLALGAHVQLRPTDGDGGELRIAARGREFGLRSPQPSVTTAVAQLSAGGATEDALCEQILQSGPEGALLSFLGLLRALDACGAIERRIVADGHLLATLVPRAAGFRLEPLVGPRDGAWALSRFAYVRARDGVASVESPLGRATVELHDARAHSLVLALAQPRSLADLAGLFPDVGPATCGALLTALHTAGALRAADGPQAGAGDSATAWWEFHDLLFHMRSRRGRHDAGYGGTYPHRPLPPPPLVQPRRADAPSRPLYRPDLDALRRTDAPFTEVLERRRSVRHYAPQPLSAEQLGEFLYRAARYQRVLPGDVTDFAFRPTPAGGALHELELYPVVHQCAGLARGVYHYRPQEHELELIATPSPAFERLLNEAWWTANRESTLNVYFQVTARCERVFWKYESMAYALILKNLGALYATMYLAATAMGLAPSALGGGDSELFAVVAGLDPYTEPAVGEFVLGSRADA